MEQQSVKNIIRTELKKISLSDGDILHFLKTGDNGYKKFGEAYFSKIKNRKVKAWKKHLKMTMNLVVPFGKVKFVFIDNKGLRRTETLSIKKYARLTVPPNIWFGFKGMHSPFSIVMNVADMHHDPKEIKKQNIKSLKFT